MVSLRRLEIPYRNGISNRCQVGPIIAGPMAEHVGWRNFWWLNVGLHALTILVAIFGLPETKWHRAHPDELALHASRIPTSSSNGDSKVDKFEGSDLEKPISPEVTDLSHTATAQRDPYLGKGGPSKQQFKLFQPNAHPFKSILRDLWIPWKLFAFPIVEFASFVVSWSASCYLTVNLTQSEAFGAAPYHYGIQKIGFFNFAELIGAFIGLFTAGPLSDWISAWFTKRNNGVREPEMRLLTLVPYVLIMILGNFIVAFGFENKWNWKVRRPLS